MLLHHTVQAPQQVVLPLRRKRRKKRRKLMLIWADSSVMNIERMKKNY